MARRVLGATGTEGIPADGAAAQTRVVGTGRRRALPASRAVVGGFLVAVAAVVVFAASLAGASQSSRSWVVTARPLPAGTVLGPGDVTSAAMRLSKAASSLAYGQPVLVEGRTLAVPLPAGALIQNPVLVPSGQRPTMRPVSFAVDSVSLAGLTPGQPVDVLGTQGTGSGTAVVVVVRGATLMAASQPGSGALTAGSSGQVTIGVASLAEVEAVVQAAHAGTITLVAAEPSDGVGTGRGTGRIMSSERYVLLGLAPARAPWFASLAQWATSAAIAAEFIKCVSADEVRARLASGRKHSALLVDSGSPWFERDVVDAARSALTPVIAVRDSRSPAFSAADLGVVAELPASFSRDQLLDVLTAHCQLIGRGDELPPSLTEAETPLWLGQLVSVCGSGGTGASTLAIALAQGMAADPRHGRRVVLADLALWADQAMLHDAADLGPGTQELVEAHRLGRPAPDEVWATTFDVPRRGYRLLLGLRQPEAWSALRPRAIDASLVGLRRAFQVVVTDVTGDVEGEAEGGSLDVEERNHLARSAVLHSSVVVAVGAPGMKGVHSLAALIRALSRIGVSPGRVVPVINRSPRNPRARAELARALAVLLTSTGPTALAGPIHIPERKLEDVLRDGGPLPAAVVDPLVHAVQVVAERQADSAPARSAGTLITPGSLGSWSEAAEHGTG